MKSLKWVSIVGAMGIFLAAGGATAVSIDGKMDKEALAAEAKAAQIAMEAKKLQDFEAALPARMALAQSVIDQFRAEFLRDGLDGAKRLSQFAALVHSTPSDVLMSARVARNAAEFADRAEKALAAGPKALGGGTDLIFYPVGPCRIADSRFSTAGILSNGVVRNYKNFSAPGQGGDGVCNVSATPGLLSGSSGNIAMNIAATSISGTGNLNVRPLGATTTTSSLNFQPGEDISNATVIKMTGGGSPTDFTILPTVNGSPGTVHVVIDLLGFYIPNAPTALDCVDTATNPGTTGTSPGTETQVSAPACAAGYTRVAMSCVENVDAILTDMSVAGGFCSYAPRTTIATSFTVGARCCRVPGNAAGRF